ncbi:MAG: extracellular solute-binding protein [bacterium]
MAKTKKTKLLSLFILSLLIISTGFSCKCTPPEVKEAMQPIEITYWRVWDDEDAFTDIINAYKVLHPNITIKYRKLRYEEYEKTLIDALAEDRGPDIFAVHNTWINKYQSKIQPLPAETTLAYQVEKGKLKKELITELRTTPSLSLRALKTNFVDAVYNDAVLIDPADRQEKIYGLPLSVDTLALFYNRDPLNKAGIPEPAKYWDQFRDDVKKLTFQNKQGDIIQSGAGIGTGTNVSRSFDLLSILMMQNGTQMMDKKTATFNVVPRGQKAEVIPGEAALVFYTDFASPAKTAYTWNDTLPNSLDAFIQGKSAMFFGYAYNLPTIKANAPKLNFDIAKLPQIEGNPEMNYANYWLETVSNKSQNIDVAWDFIQFATKAEQVASHLAKAKKPTALRSLINSQLEDLELGTFASQVLTAKSWYQGQDAAAAEKIFTDMIDAVLTGSAKTSDILRIGAQQITQTYNRNKNE